MKRRSVLDRLLSPFVTLHPGEGVNAALLTLGIFLLLTAYYVLKVVREPLILTAGGAELKSYTSAAQAVLLLVVVPAYGWVANRTNRIRLISVVTLFFIANLVVFYFLAVANTPGLGVAFFVWVGIFNLMIIAMVTGQLVDRMLDPDEDFAIRRRIPRVLSVCATQRACDGLMAALSDRRFEVRFQSARALSRIQRQHPSLRIDATAVYAAVVREMEAASRADDPQLLDPPAAGEENPALGDSLRVRTGVRTEHAFTLLSLVVAREPLQIAFKGLLTTDAVLRGTGLEYLESVLPPDIWNLLRVILDDHATRPPVARPPHEVLDALMRSSQSIELNLQEVAKKLREQP